MQQERNPQLGREGTEMARNITKSRMVRRGGGFLMIADIRGSSLAVLSKCTYIGLAMGGSFGNLAVASPGDVLFRYYSLRVRKLGNPTKLRPNETNHYTTPCPPKEKSDRRELSPGTRGRICGARDVGMLVRDIAKNSKLPSLLQSRPTRRADLTRNQNHEEHITKQLLRKIDE